MPYRWKVLQSLYFIWPFKSKGFCEDKAINNNPLSAKALVAKSLTLDRPCRPLDLRAICIPPSARYAALDLRIPSVTDNSWTLAGDLVKYVPSRSNVLRDALKLLLKKFKKIK
ncbi:Uncharacterized protein FKW44_013538 [Caligus rogercresseyi]|uniref:Uncharacterized protein n=1 Tax=Caligus rogercresseyi TaxID=217165 RepID=A0A7T8GXX1_CALRO|nr:Uncharacterized protein FKW44_013538 [Caligus rogercresseyi]